MSKGKIVTIEDRIPKLKQRKKRRANRIFIVYIFIFFLLISSIIYFQSPFNYVSKIEVQGNKYVQNADIIQLSQITNKTSFWKVNLEETKKKIISHEQISNVVIDRKFPNHIYIRVQEYNRMAYLFEQSKVYPVLSNGKILDSLLYEEMLADAPILVNWNNGDELQEMAAELSIVPESILNLISEIHHEPTEVNPLHIKVFMNDGYEVSASIHDFSKKISQYPSIVSKIPEGKKGIIDVEVGYFFKPYKEESESEASMVEDIKVENED